MLRWRLYLWISQKLERGMRLADLDIAVIIDGTIRSTSTSKEFVT